MPPLLNVGILEQRAAPVLRQKKAETFPQIASLYRDCSMSSVNAFLYQSVDGLVQLLFRARPASPPAVGFNRIPNTGLVLNRPDTSRRPFVFTILRRFRGLAIKRIVRDCRN